jgi:microcystin-dependent protein
MSVTGQKYDTKTGVRKVTLTSNPQINPLSNTAGASQNYYCLGFDQNGFQYQIDLQALPAGVVLDQIQQNQVWWVEKRTTLYRLYLYAGLFDPNTRQINSIYPLPAPATSSLNNVTVASGMLINGSLSIGNIAISGGQTTTGYVLTATSPIEASFQPHPVSVSTPPGVMLDYAGATAPSGYLLCDGSNYSTTTYAALFAAIGYAWGGSGTSFNVPDMRGRVSIGAGSGTGLTNRTLAAVNGEENHVLVSSETPLAAHTHTFTVPSSTFTVPSSTGTTSTGSSSSVSLNTSTGYSTGTGTTGAGSTGTTTTQAGTGSSSGSTGSGNANIGASSSQSAHSHGITPTAGPFWEVSTAGTGSYNIGTTAPTGAVKSARVSSEFTDSQTPSITTSASDTGHTHSLAGVSFSIGALTVNAAYVPGLSIPALSIPTMTVTGSVAIPGLTFTVPSSTGTVAAQTGLTTSGNTATTASGHNNMQPYAVVTKIIKY